MSVKTLGDAMLGPYVLQRVNSLGSLLDLAANNLGDELGCELGKGAAGGFALDDLGHLSADGSDLRRGGVCGLLDLVGATLGEGDGEQAEEVVIGGLDGDVGLDEGLPFADQRSQLVGCEVETVEVGQAVLSLYLVDTELDLAESVVLILLEIGQGDLEDAALQGVVGVLETGGSVDEGLSNTAIFVSRLRNCDVLDMIAYSRMAKDDGACNSVSQDFSHRVPLSAYLDGVPVLLGEGILGLLLETLLSL